MATLQITIERIDPCAATGAGNCWSKRGSYTLDGPPTYSLISTMSDALTYLEAETEYRQLLTDNGVTWTAEDPAIHV